MEKKQIDVISQKIENINTKLNEINKDIDIVIDEIKLELDKTTTELDKVTKELNELKQEIYEIENADEIERENKANELIDEINELTNKKNNSNKSKQSKTDEVVDVVSDKTDKTETVEKEEKVEKEETDKTETTDKTEEVEEVETIETVEEKPKRKWLNFKKAEKTVTETPKVEEVEEVEATEETEEIETVEYAEKKKKLDEVIEVTETNETEEKEETEELSKGDTEETEKSEKKVKKKSKVFSIFIVILIAVLTRLCFQGWEILENFFDAYEHSVPEVILDEIVLSLNEGEYANLLKVATFDINQFEDENSVVQNIKLDQKANYEYVKDVNNPSNYYLIRDSIKIGEVSLKTIPASVAPNEFDLPTYELDSVTFDLTPINAVVLTIPQNATVSINGIVPQEMDYNVETKEIVNFSDKYTAYEEVITITGLMNQPELKVYYDEIELHEENGRYYLPVEEEEIEYYGNLALEIAKKYANFTSNDLALEDIEMYFDKTTDTYNKVKTYDGKYYNSHSAFTFSDVVIGEVRVLSDNLIQANVSFNYTITSWSGNFDYPSDYTLYFDRTNNKVISLGMN